MQQGKVRGAALAVALVVSAVGGADGGGSIPGGAAENTPGDQPKLTDPVAYHPAGKVVLIRSRHGYLHRMYVDCRGDAEPTVLVDVGIGEASIGWLDIVEQVSEDARICTYDRSGYGYSSVGPGERTTKQIVEELHDLVTTAHIPGPYILVGHSFGGFTARYFAASYPHETVGLVLVDSSHPDQFERLAALDTPAARAYRKTIVSRQGPPQDTLNPDEKNWYWLNSSRKATFAQMNELRYFKKSAQQVGRTRLDKNLPLAVVTRGKDQLPMIDGVSLEEEWRDMQRQLTTLSEWSWQEIVAGSGHNIHQEAPDQVSTHILKVIALARQWRHSDRPPGR